MIVTLQLSRAAVPIQVNTMIQHLRRMIRIHCVVVPRTHGNLDGSGLEFRGPMVAFDRQRRHSGVVESRGVGGLVRGRGFGSVGFSRLPSPDVTQCRRGCDALPLAVVISFLDVDVQGESGVAGPLPEHG